MKEATAAKAPGRSVKSDDVGTMGRWREPMMSPILVLPDPEMTRTDSIRRSLSLTRQTLAGLSAMVVVGFVISADPMLGREATPIRLCGSQGETARAVVRTRATAMKRVSGRVREKPSLGSPKLAGRAGLVCGWVVESSVEVGACASLPEVWLDLPPPGLNA